MGFGTLFATVAFFVIMATGAFLFTSNILYTTEVVSSSLEVSSDLQNARLKTDIEIVSASVSANEISVSIDNTGSTKILDSDFEYMDVYVRYRNDSEGIIGIKRIPYNVSNPPPVDDYWTLDNPDITDDYINPGIFDPDERLRILIRVSYYINSTAPENYIKVVTPNGVWSTKTGF